MECESLYRTFLQSPQRDNSSLAATAYLPNLKRSGGIDGQKQFGAVTLTVDTKTVTAAFHLNNREAKRELKVYNNNRLLPFCPTLFLFWGKTGKIAYVPSPSSHIAQKLSLRVTLLRRLIRSGWGAGAKTLRTAALSLVY